MAAELTALALDLRAMAGRSPVRFLAPIALVAFAFALYTVVQDARESAGSNSAAAADRHALAERGQGVERRSRPGASARPTRCKSGDTPSGIAEKNDISLDTLWSSTPTSTRRRSPRASGSG